LLFTLGVVKEEPAMEVLVIRVGHLFRHLRDLAVVKLFHRSFTAEPARNLQTHLVYLNVFQPTPGRLWSYLVEIGPE
jgi:hypothetical protein